MNNKCRVVKATVRDIVRLALGSAAGGVPRAWKCVPHKVHFGTSVGEKRPIKCPIPRSLR